MPVIAPTHLPEQPWHPIAKSLREQGKPLEFICGEVRREIAAVRRLLIPGAREEQNARRARCFRAKCARDPEFREKHNKKRRDRYAANLEFRTRILERQKLYRAKTLEQRRAKRREDRKLNRERHREERNAKMRHRYATDAAYREQKLAQQRGRYARRALGEGESRHD